MSFSPPACRRRRWLGSRHGHSLGDPRARQDRPHLRPRPRAGARRRADRGGLDAPTPGPRPSPRSSASPRRTAPTRSCWPTTRSTSSTSRRHTRSTSPTSGRAWRPASTCSARSRSPCAPPTPRSWFALAGRHGCFLMEAMWTACHPVVRACGTGSARVSSGCPGTCTPSSASWSTPVPSDRLLDPALGAGALLDMGIYPLTFAHLLLGEAEELTATAVLSDRGIDLDIAIAGRYPGGALATMTASMTSWSSRRAEIATDQGRLGARGLPPPQPCDVHPDRRGRNERRRGAQHVPAGREHRAGHRPRLRARGGGVPAAAWPRGCSRAVWCRTTRP